jgi:hypothetical protein
MLYILLVFTWLYRDSNCDNRNAIGSLSFESTIKIMLPFFKKTEVVKSVEIKLFIF